MARMRGLVIATFGLLCLALAGCATVHERILNAGDRLERNTNALASRASDDAGATDPVGGYSRAAREFANEAGNFRRVADVAGDRDVVLAFEELWRRYQTLRQEINRNQSPRAQADFRPVTEAFVEVQRVVRNGYSYADTALYARGGYYFDPFYN